MTRSRTLLITCLLLFGSLHAGCSKGPYVPMDVFANPNDVSDIRDRLAIASTAAKVDTATLAQPTGFATLKGAFTLDGANPVGGSNVALSTCASVVLATSNLARISSTVDRLAVTSMGTYGP